MLSLFFWPKVIALSGLYFNNKITKMIHYCFAGIILGKEKAIHKFISWCKTFVRGNANPMEANRTNSKSFQLKLGAKPNDENSIKMRWEDYWKIIDNLFKNILHYKILMFNLFIPSSCINVFLLHWIMCWL